MKRYKALIAYDGTTYAGWQVQRHRVGVANKLEDAFFYAFKKRIKLAGASRTDAGVHAYGQVAIFDVDLSIPAEKIKKVWNGVLPPDIVIRALDEVHSTFSSRYDVAYKVYHYRIFIERPLPFVQRYGYYFSRKISQEKLSEALKVFEGTHDFSSFSSSEPFKNPIRTIDSITLEYDEQLGAYTIIFKGKSFLRYMIRRIVGACLEVASKENLDISLLKQVLLSKDPGHQLYNAPAQGLLLYQIKYYRIGDIIYDKKNIYKMCAYLWAHRYFSRRSLLFSLYL